MRPREIKPGVYYVGAVDWDRRLFDALIPLPEGTSYNAYLVPGSEKTVLFDTVDPSKTRGHSWSTLRGRAASTTSSSSTRSRTIRVRCRRYVPLSGCPGPLQPQSRSTCLPLTCTSRPRR